MTLTLDGRTFRRGTCDGCRVILTTMRCAAGSGHWLCQSCVYNTSWFQAQPARWQADLMTSFTAAWRDLPQGVADNDNPAADALLTRSFGAAWADMEWRGLLV